MGIIDAIKFGAGALVGMAAMLLNNVLFHDPAIRAKPDPDTYFKRRRRQRKQRRPSSSDRLKLATSLLNLIRFNCVTRAPPTPKKLPKQKRRLRIMNACWRKRAASVCLTALILSGCASDKALKQAAVTQGTAEARVNLPPYPEDCRAKEEHAPLVIGTEVRSVLKRERAALDRQNARTDRCAGFYDDLKAGMQ